MKPPSPEPALHPTPSARSQVVGWLTSLLLVAPLGLVVGSACAFFLWSLERVTVVRWQAPWLLYLLPLGGVVVALGYQRFGRTAGRGTRLILEEIQRPGDGVPIRMAPLVLLGTLVTHLFGGSAGREGTAVQMGGGIAAAFARAFRFGDARTLLMAGIAAGFGGVFGTPVAGAVFALEVLVLGRVGYVAIVPCLLAAIAADWACGAWGVAHTIYRVAAVELDAALLAKVVVAGCAFGLAARLFVMLLHRAQRGFEARIAAPWLRPVLGGIGVIGLALVFGADYLGLGVTSPDPHGVSIVAAFQTGGAEPWSWLLKIVFTVMTLASGFKGGEVTPLFFIGATLGNTLAGVLGGPTELFAGLGFIAVFAAAAQTPLACTIMAIELFGTGGGSNIVYFALASFCAFLFVEHAGIYRAHRVEAASVPGRAHVPDTPREP